MIFAFLSVAETESVCGKFSSSDILVTVKRSTVFWISCKRKKKCSHTCNMHICSLNWKNELLSIISESCSMTAVWCYFGTFQSIVLYNVYFQNSLDTFIFVRSCQNMFHDPLTRLPFSPTFSPTLSPLPHRSQLHISAVCAAPPLERPVTVTRVTTCSSPADKQGLGWGYPCNYMSIEETHSHYGCLLLVRIRV